MGNVHLVILRRDYLEAIIDGRKRVESRFMKCRKAPLGAVSVGDRLVFKVSSGPVCGQAIVSKVAEFEDLTAEKVGQLKTEYNSQVLGDDAYWDGKADCKFGVFVWMVDAERIEPVRISKRDMRAWVVLEKGKDWGLLG